MRVANMLEPEGEAGRVRLSVLMPVYNEARTLRTVIDRVLDALIDYDVELVCVDDASQDRSWDILEGLGAADARVRVFRHPFNRGKGAAIRTAIEKMRGEIAIIQDADLEYTPAEIPTVIRPIIDGRADAVFGSRYAASPERRVSFFWHTLGNKVLTGLSNLLNDLNLTDMETCYKAVRSDLLRDLRLTSDRFGIEPEITARLAQWGARIYEVPISYHGRSYAEGKNIGWRDGLQALWLIIRFRFLDTRFTDDAAYHRLRTLTRVPRVNRWRFMAVEDDVGRRVLEVGAGLGAITQELIDRDQLYCVDGQRSHVTLLERRFGHLDNVSVGHVDLENLDHSLRMLAIPPVDTVISFNTLECVKHDQGALRAMVGVLPPGGSLVLVVSAQSSLFSEADRRLGRIRRYDPEGLAALVRQAGLEDFTVREFNRLGGLAWRLASLLHRIEPSELWMRVFSLLLPLARLVERMPSLPGLNLVVVARLPR